MKASICLAAALVLGLSVCEAFSATPAKSKPQTNREAAWKGKMVEKKIETGQPLRDFVFLGMTMGCTRADAEAVIKAGPHKVTLVKPAEKPDSSETWTCEGNHKLAKAKSTELSFFDDRLMRVVVIFETENVDVTFAALVENLEAKYGTPAEEPPAKGEGKTEPKPDAKPAPKAKSEARPSQGRDFFRDVGGITLSMRVQRGAKGDEIVITVQDPEMLENQRETRVEKERAAIGEF